MRTHFTHHWIGKSSWGELLEDKNCAFTNLWKPGLRKYPANYNHSKHLFWVNEEIVTAIPPGTSGSIDRSYTWHFLTTKGLQCCQSSASGLTSNAWQHSFSWKSASQDWTKHLQLLPGFRVHQVEVGDGLYSSGDTLNDSTTFCCPNTT